MYTGSLYTQQTCRLRDYSIFLKPCFFFIPFFLFFFQARAGGDSCAAVHPDLKKNHLHARHDGAPPKSEDAKQQAQQAPF